MKKQYLNLVLTLLLFNLSCKEESVGISEKVVESVNVDQGVFKGLKVNLYDDLTQEDLDKTPEEFIENLNAKNGSSRSNNLHGYEISYEVLMIFFKEKMINYPEFNLENREVRRFGILKKDFPDIKTKEEAIALSDKIVEFYNIKLRNDLLDEFDTLIHLKKSSKVSDEEEANAMVITYSAIHPIASVGVYTGRSLANEYTLLRFSNANFTPNINLSDQINAYRHASWNMFSVAAMLDAGMSKTDAIGKARDFTTLHEMQYVGNTNGIKPSAIPANVYLLHANWGLKTGNDTAMDLSNDAIGRSLIDNLASYNIFKGWKNIDRTSIVNVLNSKVSVGVTYRQSNNIIGVYH